MNEKIILLNVEGTGHLSGTDQHGRRWTQFEMDQFVGDCECGCLECDPDTCPRFVTDCFICGELIRVCWLCLDGGESVCEDHVEFAPDGQSAPVRRPT